MRKILVGAGRAHWPLHHEVSERLRSKSPAGAGLLVHRLFRGYDLVDRGAFGLGVIPLLISLVQELVDDARALLLLDPSLLRFPLRGEALRNLFRSTLNPPSVNGTNGMTTRQYTPQFRAPCWPPDLDGEDACLTNITKTTQRGRLRVHRLPRGLIVPRKCGCIVQRADRDIARELKRRVKPEF